MGVFLSEKGDYYGIVDGVEQFETVPSPRNGFG